MSDNVRIKPGAVTDPLIGAKDVGGVLYQRTILRGVDPTADAGRTNPISVDQAPAATSAATTVAASASSVTLKASNSARKGLIIRNDGAATLYLGRGATATTTSPIEIPPGETLYDIPASFYGQVNGIWSSATGNARVEELT